MRVCPVWASEPDTLTGPVTKCHHPDLVSELQPRESPFSHLITFVEVVYGATLGYCFLKIGETLKEVFVQPTEEPSASFGIRVCLEIFVLDLLVHRFVESRLITAKVPYQNGNRFSIDVLMAGLFLMAFVAAEEGSAQLFVPCFFIFVLWWLWAQVLKHESLIFTEEYLKVTTWTQGIASASSLTYFLYQAEGQTGRSARLLGIGWPGVSLIWSVYVVWLGFVLLFKRRKGLDWTEVTTLPLQWFLQQDDRGGLVLFSRRKNLLSTQFLAASVILGQLLFHLAWVVATFEQDQSYVTAYHSLSDLGASTARYPWVWLLPQCIAGVTTIAFALRVLRPALRSGAGALLVTGSLMGIDNVSDAFFRVPCQAGHPGCTLTIVARSWMGSTHLIIAALCALFSAVAPFVLAREMSVRREWRDLARPTRAFGMLLIIAILFQPLLKFAGGNGAGYAQRAIALLMSVGIITLARRILFDPRTLNKR